MQNGYGQQQGQDLLDGKGSWKTCAWWRHHDPEEPVKATVEVIDIVKRIRGRNALALNLKMDEGMTEAIMALRGVGSQQVQQIVFENKDKSVALLETNAGSLRMPRDTDNSAADTSLAARHTTTINTTKTLRP